MTLDGRETSVRVVEYFLEWKPSSSYSKSLERVLGSLPSGHLSGLSLVVLRDSRDLSAREKKGRLDRLRGVYYRAQGVKSARIELFIDKILLYWPAWFRKLPVIRFEIVHRVFFHELAHHIQTVQQGVKRPHSEEKTEELAKVLWRASFKARHPALVSVFAVIHRCLKAAQSLRGRS